MRTHTNFHTQLCQTQFFDIICLPPSPFSFQPLPSHVQICLVLIGGSWHVGLSGPLIWHCFWHLIWIHIYIYIYTYGIYIFWQSIRAFYLTFYSDILFRRSIWHRFWHPIWHPFWPLFWHSLWHFFPAFILALYLTFFSGILSGIYSDSLSNMDTAGPQSQAPRGWGPAVEARSAHWDRALRCGARGWGPAVPTEIWSSWLRSGSAHRYLELAAQVRQWETEPRTDKQTIWKYTGIFYWSTTAQHDTTCKESFYDCVKRLTFRSQETPLADTQLVSPVLLVHVPWKSTWNID